jgi:hypothetical protein
MYVFPVHGSVPFRNSVAIGRLRKRYGGVYPGGYDPNTGVAVPAAIYPCQTGPLLIPLDKKSSPGIKIYENKSARDRAF